MCDRVCCAGVEVSDVKTLGQIAREAGNEAASWESDWGDDVFEAIAAAVRNEALEEAAQTCDRCPRDGEESVICASAIRSMIR